MQNTTDPPVMLIGTNHLFHTKLVNYKKKRDIFHLQKKINHSHYFLNYLGCLLLVGQCIWLLILPAEIMESKLITSFLLLHYSTKNNFSKWLLVTLGSLPF